ncbi:hypothetical protein DH2020_014160 [Rehmannia glutinosa]|uniref:Tf2-1-like SH3-like domain-containing protein n=1 Tax=Rehmannia glutinosa TaxID=99300 RepID=A0ABR0WZ74_REHGL
MLRACALDFKGNWCKYLPLAEFAYNNSYQETIGMAPYETLYGRRCRSPIHLHESRQKSYVDVRRRSLEFSVGDFVFIKVSPMKEIMRFGKKEKLSPRYVGPYMIVERIGKVAYKLELPQEMTTIYNVFHVSMLKKYIPDPSHVLTPQLIQIDESFIMKKNPQQYLIKELRAMRNREISMVKVVWRNHNRYEDATWEIEEDMRNQYPELF